MADSMRSLFGFGALGLLAPLGACSDGPLPPDPRAAADSVIVSDAVPNASVVSATARGAASLAAAPGAGADTDVAYVSLPPGTIPNGTAATIRNPRSGSSVTLLLAEGGFDPVPVPAHAGDALELAVTDGGGAAVYTATIRVPPRKSPKVVRTVPPKGRTDVPLNAIIVVVFSEPISAQTAATSTIRLTTDGQPVAGQLTPVSDGLRVEFRSDSPLAPTTDYTLVVTSGITDLSGDRLEQPVEVTFRTGSALATPESVAVSPPAVTVMPGESQALSALAYDALGRPLRHIAWAWSSANPGIATVSDAGLVRGVAFGTTTVTATADGLTATARVDVVRLVFASVTNGVDYTCGVTTSGQAYCWGVNGTGTLGTGDTLSTSTPRPVAGGLTFISLSAASTHTCGLATSGTAYCWGSNTFGELGDGSTAPSTATVAVAGGLRFVDVTTGWNGWDGSHSCGLTAGGAAYCWGDGRFGQLGTGRGDTDTARYDGSPTPVPVSGGLTFKSLSAGFQSTCGLTGEGAAYCWGVGDQLSAAQIAGAPPAACIIRGSVFAESCSTRPVAVAPGLAFETLSNGMFAACGLTSGGTGYCWGSLPREGGSAPPGVVSGGLSFAAVSVGHWYAFTCAVSDVGAAYCWGRVPVDAGGGWTAHEWISGPRAVPGGHRFASISTGGSHACGITPGGGVYCWGANHWGQLGNGSRDYFSAVPVKVKGQP